MTRINLVDPTELMDQHLIAEYREIRLLCGSLRRTLNSKSGYREEKIPKEFTLATGHVYFFYNKGKYLHERYESLKQEMVRRGFTPNLDFPIDVWPAHLYNNWAPSEQDKNIIRARIAQRISERPGWYRYYGKK